MSKLAMPKVDRKLIAKKAEIVSNLKKIVKAENILDHEDQLRPFETDALSAYKKKPLIVVFPENTIQVSKVLEFCNRERIKVVPRGAGTGLSGGSLPLEDSILLCLTKFNKIIDIESEVSSSVDPYSDWSFNRITLTSSVKSSASFSEDNLLKKFVGFTYGGYRGRVFAGKIWTNKSGVPNQEAYNIEGNSSADMFRISYLRNQDSFFGITEINNNYHMAGEGNIRGFVSQNEKGADAAGSVTSEIFMVNKRVDVSGYLEDSPISFELAFFADGGIFYNNGSMRKLGDAGIGIRLSSTVYDKPLYLRLDFPLILFKDGDKLENDTKWVISFQRSI